MYGNSGVQRYRETDLGTMTKEKMIVLLYEKIIQDLENARTAIEADDRVEMTRLVNHSQRIVSELRAALDHSIGGDVSRNLESLYDYLFHEHLLLLVDCDQAHVTNSVNVVTPLLEAWRQIPSGTGDLAARDRARGILPEETGPDPASTPVDEPVNQPADTELPAEPVAGNSSLLSVSA